MSARDIIVLGCSSQQPTRFRNHGAYLIRWNGEGLLFDPGEGTQRQFIFANLAPTVVSRIFITHFHGDHCLGVGSMLMRLNLDKISHPIHCYYPAAGKKNFNYLRHGCVYRENITVVEHPVRQPGLVEDDGRFRIEAVFLEHGIENIGWRITEPDTVKFHKESLDQFGIEGPMVQKLELDKKIRVGDHWVHLDEVSHVRKGDSIAFVTDTRFCQQAVEIAREAKILICESTYLEKDKDKAAKYMHMTARQAAQLAHEANVGQLILTHFSARIRDLQELLREAQEIFPNVAVAEDLRRFAFSK
jgi:ribonuclease Z